MASLALLASRLRTEGIVAVDQHDGEQAISGVGDLAFGEIELPPDPHLLESLRAVGYSFETAVADVIDNAIAANANVIHLLTSREGTPQVSIFDDGEGMTRTTAIRAMKLAAQSPTTSRGPTDLGRFGLGLKTASLSQCRRLTVATKRDGVLTILRWDLDYVIDSGRWIALELQRGQASSLFGGELLDAVDSGTLICWDDLDLLMMTEGSTQADFDSAVARVRDHCCLVFHRFITGDDARKISMTVNGAAFPGYDPFLTRNRATELRTEDLKLSGELLSVKAYTLPFINKLSQSERHLALAPGGFRDSQGFYVYRAGRLVVWGTWFRLNPKSEMGKLARVRVDVPNSLDHLWVLDIKKSSANPPRELREALRKLALQFVLPSTRIQQFRGRKPKAADKFVRAWDVVVDRNSFRYEVNREHPVISAFAARLDPITMEKFEGVLEVLEQSFPVLDAHNRLSQDAVAMKSDGHLSGAVANAVSLRPMFYETHADDESFIAMFETLEPYSHIEGFKLALRTALAQ